MNFVLHRRITICMLFIALTLLGYVSYKQLPVELLPNAELPMLFVQVSSQQENDPSYVESDIIIPLEGAISSIGGVEKIESTVDSRQSFIQIDFKKNINFKMTSLRLEEKINEVAAGFPEGINVQVHKIDTKQLTNNFMVVQVRGSGGVDRVRNVVDKEVLPELENIDGVAAANVFGGRERAIEIQLDPEACKALNLTAAQISNLLAQNTREKEFVGYVNESYGKFFVHINSLYTHVSELENIVVAPGPILLKDIATIFFDLKEETTFSRVNGKEAVAVALTNDSQANLIELSHRTLQVIERLNEELRPMDVEIVVQNNTAQIMEDNINQIIELALTGGLLAILILWVFLRNLRLVFFIALSIPISVYTAFNLFYAFGISINSLTLVGMALAVGMLLDNSVVVLENIYRLSGGGMPAERAVTQGTKEVWRSILAATLTTVTVFLPFVFSDNFLIKMIGHHIGVSIVSTLVISLFVALLFIPMATYLILKRKKGKSVFYEKVSVRQRAVQVYLVFLKTCMRNPGVTILGAVVVLFVTLILSITLNIQQMRDVDSDRFNIYVSMQTGSTLETTDLAVRVMEDRLAEFPEKEELVCRVQEREAVLTLILKEDYQKIGKRKIADIKAEVQRLLRNINGAEVSITEASGGNSGGGGGGGGGGASMGGMGNFMRLLGIGDNQERIVIKGADFEMMQVVAEDFRYYLNEQEFIRSSRVSSNRRQPEILLNFDPILLTSYEISRGNISAGLMTLNGDLSSGSSFKVGDESYDIIIRNSILTEEEEEQARRDKTVDDLRAIQVQSGTGGLHRLDDIAAIEYGRGRSQILRVNQDKQIEVYYNFSRDVESSKSLLEGYRADIDRLVADYNLPSGVAVEVFHEEDAFAEFKFLIFAAFILIFMILASVFESLSTPFVLLFAIPLAAIGSLVALLITGNSLLNANTLTGFLILLGVVVNNSIILIDYANILRRRGFRRSRALMTAGLSRIRPILITSITTIVAMLPLAMGDSEYAGAIGAPFAITVIGGLTFSALLTLILVPTACMGMENTLQWYRTLSKRMWFIHAVLFAVGTFCIWYYAEGLLWQIIYFVTLVIAIPGMTYFAQNSLRRAQAKVIDPQAEIEIVIRNLVKIYDWPGRFSRQWQSGLNLRRRLGLENEFHRLKDFIPALWQFVLFGFGVWFTYVYLDSDLWLFLLSIAIYFSALALWRKLRQYLFYRYPARRWIKILNRVVFWGIPLLILTAMFRQMDSPNLVITIGLLWGVGIAIYITSHYLYDNQINIERVKGRFAGLRRSWFRLVKSIPLIGKQRKPFKALRGVSFTIRTGMFGLLGPNGAGKSTLMRIVCGILEQSYGSIWINGLDTRVYREELQSLIGFLPQEFGTYENMSSTEFLDYQAILKGITDADTRRGRIEYVLKAVHMYERKDDKIGSFSGGMKQRIGIALILLHLPRILIVDEPTAGLDPRERIRFRNLLVELSKERIVIFSTHIIEDIASSCNQVVVINKGDLKYFGHPSNMVGMAEGKIWKFSVTKEQFEQELDPSLVIHHIQDEETIQVRYLSTEQPFEGAVRVEPNLEDAYLCLLKQT
ncbi:efflux RND transporter permease subunit [Parabacteroides sp. PF5-6]|uniref:efflux RND transporter permease subunit n=1 Tax=Parabacteroides sp. PF5-6 TaxID=1742403 RepID=UPI0024057B46|nr:efflux RND transporter permease subunit [Parabacteroides sp. PF5-6]MDF9830043.1 multidrug efflux pump subunit AcrB/ABC-type multidrug transport system ATPase subunit [Parabacteroides sp. PF5-6]